MNLNVLAFAPHPDDAELFCGGTLIKLAENGMLTGIVDLSGGELSTRGNPEIRGRETKEASQKLGLVYRSNLNIEDGNIGNTKENRFKVIEEIRKTRPEFVFLPYWEDRHPDHINASHLVRDACYFSGLEKIKTGQPEYRPMELIYYYMHQVKEPRLVVDISAQYKRKMESVKAYKSQFYDEKSSNTKTYISSREFLEFIGIRARYFGFQAGVEYGEPFFVEHPVKIANLCKLFT
jgi:N-acetylglucosamine malate deacetylase 1